MNNYLNSTLAILADQQTTIQIGLVLMAFMAAQIVSTFLRRKITILREEPSPGEDEFGTATVALFRLGGLLTPLLARYINQNNGPAYCRHYRRQVATCRCKHIDPGLLHL